ncbi:MAG: cob(I)yrinic acid a,c-diamide adenosyltransferase [Candidatus Komeilibacteria bacterium]|nr:cob(I)yrinic acid a,c-diamide adenosyltransferase [Candidatus Komeilibacteria bacterium]
MNNLAQSAKAPSVSEERRWGKIQLYTGHGKGKTTAALGLVIRALGRGKKCAIVYFDKGGDHYGERKILAKLKETESLDYFVFGLKRFNEQNKTFRFGVTAADQQAAARALIKVRELFKDPALDLLVLDEINSTLALGMLKLGMVLELLAQKPEQLELVLTGRDALPELLAKADLVTEMKLVKHYFYQGQEAREGMEY